MNPTFLEHHHLAPLEKNNQSSLSFDKEVLSLLKDLLKTSPPTFETYPLQGSPSIALMLATAPVHHAYAPKHSFPITFGNLNFVAYDEAFSNFGCVRSADEIPPDVGGSTLHSHRGSELLEPAAHITKTCG
ncbi:hypothetical protein ACLOJK_006907 [Asimina triloba]